jgi:hypothetical protein
VIYTSIQLEAIEESPFAFLVPAAAKSHLRSIREFLVPSQPSAAATDASKSSSSSAAGPKKKTEAKSD